MQSTAMGIKGFSLKVYSYERSYVEKMNQQYDNIKVNVAWSVAWRHTFTCVRER